MDVENNAFTLTSTCTLIWFSDFQNSLRQQLFFCSGSGLDQDLKASILNMSSSEEEEEEEEKGKPFLLGLLIEICLEEEVGKP